MNPSDSTTEYRKRCPRYMKLPELTKAPLLIQEHPQGIVNFLHGCSTADGSHLQSEVPVGMITAPGSPNSLRPYVLNFGIPPPKSELENQVAETSCNTLISRLS